MTFSTGIDELERALYFSGRCKRSAYHFKRLRRSTMIYLRRSLTLCPTYALITR